MAQENYVWNGTPSQVVNMGTYIIWSLLALTMFLIPISIIVILYKYFDVKCTKYELTTQRLKTHVGVFSRKIDELELYRVKDMQFEQPFFLRLFGLGNVVLVTSDSTSPVIKIEAIPNAQDMLAQIRGLVEESRTRKGVRVREF